MKYDFQYQSGARSFEADFGRVINATDGGFERGYAAGYTEGETAATEAAEAANAVILADCNEVLPTKGASTAETLEQVPQRIGEIKSYADGYDVGVEDGKQAEHDRFWDAYQQNGKRTDYQMGFAGAGWTDETFRPKYDIIVPNAYMLFHSCRIKDLGEALRKAGVRLVIRGNTMSTTFYNTLLEIIDGVEFDTTFTSINGSFYYNSYLREIRVPIPVIETTDMSGFNVCVALQEVRFSGVIGRAMDLHWSASLSNDSVQNIIDCLKDLTGATAQTLTFHATVGAKLTEAQKATITAKNWTLVY